VRGHCHFANRYPFGKVGTSSKIKTCGEIATLPTERSGTQWHVEALHCLASVNGRLLPGTQARSEGKAMTRTVVALLVTVRTGVGLVAAGEPPYKRLLQGDDANKVAALSKLIDELWAAGKFAEAVAPAEEELTLRRRVQGRDTGR
jgi:hypothetical protein